MQSIQCIYTRKRFYDCEQSKNYVTRSMCASNQQNNQFKCEFQLQVILRFTFTSKLRQIQSKESMKRINLDFFFKRNRLTYLAFRFCCVDKHFAFEVILQITKFVDLRRQLLAFNAIITSTIRTN